LNIAWKEDLWRQFGAAIDMLENAIVACPDEIWSDRSRNPEFWYVAYHTLFFLDLYNSDSLDGFSPPEPFTLDELDPAGVMPPEPFDKALLLLYLAHGREKCRSAILSLTEDRAFARSGFERLDLTVLGLLLDNLRHVQHHAAQLNLVLRQSIDSAPRWVSKTARPLVEGP
jgi:hypothetical protein